MSLRADKGYWYMRAYSFERGEERTYRVDRILNVTEPAPGFRPFRPNPSRPYQDESHPQVVARLTPRGVGMVEIEPHLGSQVLREPDGSGTLSLRCPPSEIKWYAGYFASLGDEVEVIAPPELQERMRELGERLMKRYGSRLGSYDPPP